MVVLVTRHPLHRGYPASGRIVFNGSSCHLCSSPRISQSLDSEYASLPAGARLMYGCAMFYLTVGALSLSCRMINLLVLWTTPSSQPTTETGNPPEGPQAPAPTPLPCTRCNEIHEESDDDEFFCSMIFFISASNMTIITWMASWLFWAGFVKAAGERHGHDHHTIERIHDSS